MFGDSSSLGPIPQSELKGLVKKLLDNSPMFYQIFYVISPEKCEAATPVDLPLKSSLEDQKKALDTLVDDLTNAYMENRSAHIFVNFSKLNHIISSQNMPEPYSSLRNLKRIVTVMTVQHPSASPHVKMGLSLALASITTDAELNIQGKKRVVVESESDLNTAALFQQIRSRLGTFDS